MREVLAPYIVSEQPQHNFALIEFGDGPEISGMLWSLAAERRLLCIS
jgi:hypothetical protein